MEYTAKAYVRITDDKKRNAIVADLEKIGYKNIYGGSVGDNVVVIKEGVMAIDYAMPCDCIDCNAYTPNGTEEEAVKLFLTLAEMRDDAGSDAKWIICDCPHFDDMYNKTFERDVVIDSWKYQQVDRGLFSVATPLEVAQAFKDGRIEL